MTSNDKSKGYEKSTNWHIHLNKRRSESNFIFFTSYIKGFISVNCAIHQIDTLSSLVTNIDEFDLVVILIVI